MAASTRQQGLPQGRNSPLSLVFLLHILLESPLLICGIASPMSLPFMDITNTTLVMIKLLAAASLGSCIAAGLVFPLPDFLPGKRALALSFLLYHAISSMSLLGAPRFIPISFGGAMESLKVTPENTWAFAHGFLSLVFAAWWQATIPQAQAMAGVAFGQKTK